MHILGRMPAVWMQQYLTGASYCSAEFTDEFHALVLHILGRACCVMLEDCCLSV